MSANRSEPRTRRLRRACERIHELYRMSNPPLKRISAFGTLHRSPEQRPWNTRRSTASRAGCQTTPPWTTAAQTSPAQRARANLPLARSVTTLPSYSIKRKTLRQRLDRISVSSESHGRHGPCADYGTPTVRAVSLGSLGFLITNRVIIGFREGRGRRSLCGPLDTAAVGRRLRPGSRVGEG